MAANMLAIPKYHFPQAFSKEEQNKLINSLSYPILDEEIKKTLVEHNIRLVIFLARKFENTGVELDDLISIGNIGLMKAVNTFNPEKKTQLATYASRCIENEILMYLRKNTKIKANNVSLYEPLIVDPDGNELLLEDIKGDTEADNAFKRIDFECDMEFLQYSLNKLTPRNRLIISLRYGLNMEDYLTQKEVATLLNISQSYISRLEKRVIVYLQKEYKKYSK